jgi:ABC-type multidrug transport system fused ATPase/permease subunit
MRPVISLQGERFYKLLKFLGRKGLFWFCISTLSAVVMAGVEISLSVALALLLRSLGVATSVPTLPLGMGSWSPKPGVFALCLVSVGCLRGALQVLVAQSMMFSSAMVEFRLKQVLLLKYFKMARLEGSLASFHHSLEFFSKANHFVGGVLAVLPALIQAVILFLILSYKNPQLTMVGIGGLLLSGFFLSRISKTVVSLGSVINGHSQAWNKQVVRSIRNWNMLRALRLIDQEYRAIAVNQFTQVGAGIHAVFLSNILSALPQLLGVILATGLILMQLVSPRITGLEFIGYLYLFLRFVQCLGVGAANIGLLSANFVQFREAIRFFFSFSSEEISEGLANANMLRFNGSNWRTVGMRAMFSQAPKKFPRPVHSRPPEIRLSQVSFSYANKKILENLSLVIAPGDSLAIVGPSGSGKSTLLSIILGIFEPESGRVTINNMSPDDYFRENPYSVGYVVADPYLVEGSIRDNLLYGNPFETTESMLIEALTLAHLRELVETLPGGLDYKITENGDGLSTGQKQRLSLARALLRDPALLVLDEISANLDPDTEAEIVNTLQQINFKATILVVSHRVGLVAHISNRINLGDAVCSSEAVPESAQDAERA